MKRILLLGAGELGKEVVIAAKRMGQYVIAIDAYEGAPAMQVADEWACINMLDGEALDRVVDTYRPDLIVPEIEAIRTERFFDYEQQGYQVVPSARAANFTMNRKAIRNLAAEELGLRTAKYRYATTLSEFESAVTEIGIPCVVKPLMSSSGKGQSVVKSREDIEKSWHYAMEGKRGDLAEVIVEEFIHFESEITLLTVTQKNGDTLFCPPIGHRQERGDYQESWQPAAILPHQLEEAKSMAASIIRSLTGQGLWGVEFFLTKDSVYFSELSPRPHDTGMVTLAGTQTFNEFELHLRAILGWPIPELKLERAGASAVILADGTGIPVWEGIEEALNVPQGDLRIFGKPSTRPYRRMGVALAYGIPEEDTFILRKRAKMIADKVKVNAQ
ncbi:MAG: formate-dependent phosphoribosylglycinamide formyltransferase [Chitinophagales bacterium]|nr:formate-dependent phosphoribosylglycinamide formyltransferase [Chitinophagales bacterium]